MQKLSEFAIFLHILLIIWKYVQIDKQMNKYTMNLTSKCYKQYLNQT